MRASESAPPDTAHCTCVPATGKVQRKSSSVVSIEIGPSVMGGTERETWLLLALYLTLATVWVARCADLEKVTDDSLEHRSDTCDEEDYSDPPMPNIRCEHGSIVAS